MFKVKIKILFSLIFFLFVSTNIQSQIFSEDDIKIYNQKISFADKNELSKKPLNEVITEVGKDFIGTEYVAHTLEKDGDEQLVINLSGLDCTTFLETSLTLARCIKKGKTSFKDYQNELTFVRYRDGKIDKYPSRLHYFSDWIYNNQQKEIVKDVTKEIGGEKIKFNLNFMTKNPEFYKQLKENSDFIPIIRKQEKEINNRTYYYIPKAKVESIENKIESGDLIAITSSVKGLDINHVGLAIKMEDGQIHFLHAPLVGSKVQITPEPLHEYLKKINKHTGIIVLRALD
ncbi:MAG: hypothetical protein B6D44_05275 [Ignavibacteriales bacterium UTCHB2]|jgi:hypothetical protein|nr:MAG: hypothetical protein BWY38_02396 [Ignavibacteria bacterium ADurb.Bin266]OQY74099.1 MAG: hypothetical protein B6D44_05275 [Ignavibacteriales bacterium UTCHB2]HQI42275.1 DUF1460 domain-containing protein [Ignavibacteriaceae bacterium]HQJ45164.1 DUF1460 domain-containing protein [Ignavibacteriaceae bacterium]